MLQTFVILNEMVAEGAIKDYALCRAIAAFRYIEPAATHDMDVTVEMARVSAFVATFDDITNFLARKNMPLEWDEEGIEIAGVPVQFIPVGGDLDKEALATAEIVTEDDVSFKVWRAEYLMAKCLQIGRPKDHIRLTQFLETHFDQDMFCTLVSKFGLAGQWSNFCRKFDTEDFCGRP